MSAKFIGKPWHSGCRDRQAVTRKSETPATPSGCSLTAYWCWWHGTSVQILLSLSRQGVLWVKSKGTPQFSSPQRSLRFKVLAALHTRFWLQRQGTLMLVSRRNFPFLCNAHFNPRHLNWILRLFGNTNFCEMAHMLNGIKVRYKSLTSALEECILLYRILRKGKPSYCETVWTLALLAAKNPYSICYKGQSRECTKKIDCQWLWTCRGCGELNGFHGQFD